MHAGPTSDGPPSLRDVPQGGAEQRERIQLRERAGAEQPAALAAVGQGEPRRVRHAPAVGKRVERGCWALRPAHGRFHAGREGGEGGGVHAEAGEHAG